MNSRPFGADVERIGKESAEIDVPEKRSTCGYAT
jgi:hypothetical protein